MSMWVRIERERERDPLDPLITLNPLTYYLSVLVSAMGVCLTTTDHLALSLRPSAAILLMDSSSSFPLDDIDHRLRLIAS